MEEAWVNSILRAAREAGTAFHFKQWGGIRKKATGRTLHDRTYDEYPSFEITV
jgi:protein gp37